MRKSMNIGRKMAMSKINQDIRDGAHWRISNRKHDREVEYELVPGPRNNNPLLYVIEEQQLYKRQLTTPDCIYYICNLNECRCKMLIREGNCYVGLGCHEHSNQAQTYINLCALNKMKETMRSADNQLSPKKVFDKVKKRYSNSTIMFNSCKKTLTNIRNEVVHKAWLPNLKEETDSDLNDTTLDAADCKFEPNSGVSGENPVGLCLEGAAIGQSVIDCKPIVPISSRKSVDFENVNHFVDLTNIDTITKPKPKPHDTKIPFIDLTSDLFYKAVRPLAESTKIASNWSSQVLTICSPIAQPASVPRNVAVSEKAIEVNALRNVPEGTVPDLARDTELGNDTADCIIIEDDQYQSCMEDVANATLGADHIEPFELIRNDLSISNEFNNLNLRVDSDEATVNTEPKSREQLTSSIDLSPVLSKTLPELGNTYDARESPRASTTCARIDYAAKELRKASSRSHFDVGLKLVPSQLPLADGHNNNNWTLHSPPQRVNGGNFSENPETSTDEPERPTTPIERPTTPIQGRIFKVEYNEASTACPIVVRATHEQQNVPVSNEPEKPPSGSDIDCQVPSTSTSTNELRMCVQVYINEKDFNKLIESYGTVRIVEGKIHFKLKEIKPE